MEFKFKIDNCNECGYAKYMKNGYIILCFYVNDMLIVGSNKKMTRSTKKTS